MSNHSWYLPGQVERGLQWLVGFMSMSVWTGMYELDRLGKLDEVDLV